MVNIELRLPDLEDLYKDSQTCAALVGLRYIQADDPGFTRKAHGKTFRYYDSNNKLVSKNDLKKHIAELVIPPAWNDVWICSGPKGHILATGIDDKERKQYIYHPRWRTMRDLIKFYRLIIFGESLPAIRRHIDANIRKNNQSYDHIVSVMLWIMDNSYIRIGNDIYFEENESIGLSTMTNDNAVVDGSVVTFSFQGKSGKELLLAIDNTFVAETVKQCKKSKENRLFTYQESGKEKPVLSSDINNYLHDISGKKISAKDFRTWGGSLLAFNHLVHRLDSDKKPEKASVEAIDAAAGVLGNTRAVARSSYVHPHMLEMYGSKNFKRYYQAAAKRKKNLLSIRESELLQFLKILLEKEFNNLRNTA